MNDRKVTSPSCATCNVSMDRRICLTSTGIGSKGCPTLIKKDISQAAQKSYLENEKLLKFARQAAIQESECYANRHEQPYVLQPIKPRILEIIEFAQKMDYQKLGLAFCIGLHTEAAALTEILNNYDFEVVSAVCKSGAIAKEKLGLTEEHKIYRGREETICNPLFQAEVLNSEETDFNLMLGLCVGHDSIFLQYSQAPVTVVAVKDRVTGHNPLAALYLSGCYFERIKNPGKISK